MTESATKPRQIKISCPHCMQKLDVTSLTPFSRIICPSCKADLIVPKWFDSYLLEESGGVGGMATVFRALDLALDREVAIKILKPEVTDSAVRSELFLHEARTAATINHYAVVPIYTCGVYEGQTYIIMQFMGGGSLEQKLQNASGELPVRDVVTWIRDVAEGLDNARAHGIVHHDIKPANILLDLENNAKIGDFGIAQIADSKGKTDEKLSRALQGWISPHYVSPEKLLEGKEDYKGDIYSLGVTFYTLITGVTPFSSDDLDELLRIRLDEDPLAPHVHRPEIGTRASSLILAMMNRDPKLRPEYKEIVLELNMILQGNTNLPHDELGNMKKTGTIRFKPQATTTVQPIRNIIPLKKRDYTALWTTGLLLLVLAGGAYWGWKAGYLEELFPGLAPQVSLHDPLPEITESFRNQNTDAAAAFAQIIANDPEEPPEKRFQAAARAAIGLYLNNDPRAVEIVQSLLSTLISVPGFDSDSPEGVVLNLLAGKITGRTSKKEDRAKPALARFLFSVYGAEDPKIIQDDFAVMQKCVAILPESAWIKQAFKNQISTWEQAISDHSGKKQEIVPLFRPLISSDAEWKEKNIPVTLAELFDSDQGDAAAVAPKTDPGTAVSGTGHSPVQSNLTADKLRAAAQPFLDAGRSAPQAPANIAENAAWLDTLDESARKAEILRLKALAQSVEYLSFLAARSPCTVDQFTDLAGTKYGRGNLMINRNYIVHTGQDSVRIRWDQLPATEFLALMDRYLSLRESVMKNASGAMSSDWKQDLAKGRLRHALLASWYGDFDAALSSIETALSISPDTIRHVNQYFLQ